MREGGREGNEGGREEGSASPPRLASLELESCAGLEEVPEGLGHVAELRLGLAVDPDGVVVALYAPQHHYFVTSAYRVPRRG